MLSYDLAAFSIAALIVLMVVVLILWYLRMSRKVGELMDDAEEDDSKGPWV